jgi:D-lactate dehydrogenase
MKAADKLQAIAQHFAQKVEIPLQGGCCGMAGDRGFLFPELTKSSAKASCDFLPENNGIIYSSTASCEIALSESLGLQAKSILTLIETAFEDKKV